MRSGTRAPARGGEAGVTLVELSVTLVIVALLAAAAYPFLNNILAAMSSKGAVEQLAGAIRLARQFAITNGVNHCIEFQGSPPKQYRIVGPTDGSCAGGSVIAGYNWTDLAHGEAMTTAPSMVFDPIGNRILPTGSGNSNFNVDTVPASCLSTVSVTLYGGVRVQRC